ncbi:LAMI_0H19834g1_1 [Lachancea mirantina]|uniref:Autophagy-related protein 13 n=1 Tax=Lachancea mirantina TaxID=1230905 RepID=A0A1G4KK41_9SACH|nr:LAMI_0H19834g1_1 [Lachancea mirantina]
MTTESDSRLCELIDNFFLKAATVICHSRTSGENFEVGEQEETNKWFNIETRDDATIEEEIKDWVSFDGQKQLQPLVIEVFLDLRDLGPSHSVILRDQDDNPWNVCKGTKKSEIMLERWLIQLEKNPKAPTEETDISEIYRQLVLLFRYLYTLVSLLPANDLNSRLSKPATSQQSFVSVNVKTRILDGSEPIVSKGRVGLSKGIIATYTNMSNETNIPPHLEQRKITPISTVYGSLRISVSYRRDCNFIVVGGDDSSQGPYTGSVEGRLSRSIVSSNNIPMRKLSMNRNRSMSISPNTTLSPNLYIDPSPQRRLSASSRQFQPFKVGSVGSSSTYNVPQGQGSLTRNPSGSSIVAALRGQKSSTGYNNIYGNVFHDSQLEASSIGSGSASKYSSSFGRIRRQSSVRRSDSTERPQRPVKSNESLSGDLIDFMKLLEDKKELKLRNSQVSSVDISNSLIKFQSMKGTNDTLSDDLSMSLSIEQSSNQKRRSSSHSPHLSFSPPMHYSSIPMRLSRSRSISARGDGASDMTSGKSIHSAGSGTRDRQGSLVGRIVEDDDLEEEELLASNARILGDSKGVRSTSPGSVRSISSSFSRSQLPFKSIVNFSNPTTMATPAHAKLHKAVVGNSSQEGEDNTKKADLGHGDDDDDLLFFMSDMNLSK